MLRSQVNKPGAKPKVKLARKKDDDKKKTSNENPSTVFSSVTVWI